MNSYDIEAWVVILSGFWITGIVLVWIKFVDWVLRKQKAKEKP